MIRSLARKFGVDVRRFPNPDDPAHYLSRYRIGGVLDVGGNVGQYGQSLRAAGFGGRIVSVEPLPDAFAKLRQSADGDRGWQCHNFGLGDAAGELPLNVGTATDFSSFLAPTGFVNEVNGLSRMAATVSVPVRRADEAWADLALPDDVPLMLKVDTQGYELPVLRGAGDRLAAFSVVQLEMSIRPLYEGQPPFHEVMAFLRAAGFAPAALIRGYDDWRTGELLEVDGIFVRV